MHTKNGKRATTFLLPIVQLQTVVEQWDAIVRSSLPGTSPWFALIEHHWGEQILSDRKPGKNRHQALNKRLRVLYQVVGLPYKSAHKFRHGHAVYGLQHAQTMVDYKAVSMNLMHEDIKTTDQIYAPILSDEVAQRIAGLSTEPAVQYEDELVAFLNSLSDAQISQAMVIAAQRLVNA